MMELSFNPVGHVLAVALVAAVLIALAVWAPMATPLSRSRRVVLAALRGGAIGLLLLAMLRPALVYTEVRRQPATLVILVDRSASMTVPDGSAGNRRWDELKATLQESARGLAALPEELEIRVYAFDAEVEPLSIRDGAIPLDFEPEGKQTAIGAALADVLRREAGKRLLGVVLLSDGAQRATPGRNLLPEEPVARLRDLGCPLYTVAFGQPASLSQVRDVALDNLQDNSPVFEKNPLILKAEATAAGFVNQSIPVKLYVEDDAGRMQPAPPSDTDQTDTRITAAQPGQVIPLELSFTPPRAGEFKILIEAQPQPGELVLTNNRLSTFVTVLKGGLNILYIEGARRVEQKYLRQSLDSSPDINVEYLFIDPYHPRETRPADLLEKFQPGAYDVYVLGDVPARVMLPGEATETDVFTREELQSLADAVRRGAGLIMIGGFFSFGPGGYQHTPLAEVLPIVMDPLEKQDLGASPLEALHVAGPLRMVPTEAGLRHYVMRLAPGAANAETWARLPPLEGANRFTRLKPGALPLANTDSGQPLLVAQAAGNGRVLAFGGDSTWRWWMRGFVPQHKRFWRQVALFLAKKDDTDEKTVWIKLPRRRFQPGERIDFLAGTQSPEGDALPDAQLAATVRRIRDAENQPVEEPAQTVRLVRQGDEFSGTILQTDAPGDYEIHVTAQQGGAALGEAKARLLVFDQDLERDKPAANRTLLASLAEMTAAHQGRNLAPEQLPGLIEELQQKQTTLDVQVMTRRTLWDNWPFFLAFVGLLSVEWYLRKRWRLV